MISNEPDFLNFQKIGNMQFQGEYDFPKIKGLKLKHPENVDEPINITIRRAGE